MMFILFEVCLKVSEKVMEFSKTNRVFAGAKRNGDLFVFGDKVITSKERKGERAHQRGT